MDEICDSPGGLPACPRTQRLRRSPPQAGEESAEPAAGVCFWQGQTEQEAAGCAPHRCYITYRSGKAFPANGVGRMLVGQEVRPFEEPVARENRLVAGLRLEDGRVIADSQGDGSPRRLAPRRPGTVRDLSQKSILILKFVWHGVLRGLQSICERQYNL